MKASPHNLARLVSRLRGRRIGVVGDVMLDRYLSGTATRLSPEAAVPVVDFVEQSECLGGAGNVAANLAALGARVTLFGVVGEDEAAAALRKCLAALALPESGLVAEPGRVTTVKSRIIARHQQVVRVDREKRASLGRETEERLIRRIKAALGRMDALVVSDYDKGVVTDALAERVLSECHRLGRPAFVKPKTSRLFSYRGATAIVCNAKEAGFFVARALEDDESVEQVGAALLAHFGCSAVVITRGDKGMSVFEDAPAGKRGRARKVPPQGFHIPATSFEVSYARVGLPGLDRHATGRQVFDVTGGEIPFWPPSHLLSPRGRPCATPRCSPTPPQVWLSASSAPPRWGRPNCSPQSANSPELAHCKVTLDCAQALRQFASHSHE